MADITVTLTNEEAAFVLNELHSAGHGQGSSKDDFEPECPSCTAADKLDAAMANHSGVAPTHEAQRFIVSDVQRTGGIVTLVTINAEDVRELRQGDEVTVTRGVRVPIAYADRIAFESAMKVGKGCDVWPKAGDYTERTGRELIALYTDPAGVALPRDDQPKGGA